MKYKLQRTKQVGKTRCGTGDIFSAIILADAVNGVELERSVRKAAGVCQGLYQGVCEDGGAADGRGLF